MKIALFTVEGLPNARAVRQLVSDHADEIVYVGISDTHRPQVGGSVGQVKAHLSRSGFWMIPYLFVNFCLPDLTFLFAQLLLLLGFKLSPQATPLPDLCWELGIPVHVLDNVNHPSVVEAMKKTGVDLIISFHFDMIFRQKTLDSVPYGGINVHPAMLPLHRGPFPTFHALMDSDPVFGVTVHKLAAKIDAGEILEQSRLHLPRTTTATKSAVLLFDEGRECVDRVLIKIRKMGCMPTGRVNPPAKYFQWPTKHDMAEFYAKGRRLVDWGDVKDALSLSS
ncbi:formyl transferase domain-containing protein [Stachybotrys elegans]|uniref:Formyl transferase domain-containing protein n=1 Tax=Stachybotrys elegans TaxID=80388 RepID=A0A8K0WMQ6_9HYPO|nr:formyl transferase domain-containing protein [Stachybotrys elegans]